MIQKLIIAGVIVVVCFCVWCMLKVASDADDQAEEFEANGGINSESKGFSKTAEEAGQDD